MVSVKLSDLIYGFDFASAAGPFESRAFVDLDTGVVHCKAEDMGIDEDLPDDLETSERYIAIPHKNDFDLGRALALAFVEETLPDDYDTAVGYFRSRGAYSRFKGLLDARGVTAQWYDFESKAVESALRQWCEENDIQVVA
jgi:hypothetical protein